MKNVDKVNQANILTESGLPLSSVGGDVCIYFISSHKILFHDLVANSQLGKNVKLIHFANLAEVETNFSSEVPSAIILEVEIVDDSVIGEEAIIVFQHEIEEQIGQCPPIIIVSERKDISARLAAVRINAYRYFSKPLEQGKLFRVISNIIIQQGNAPYRVLFIDDDEDMLKYYVASLQKAGIKAEGISNSLETLDVLARFKPDVIVLDIHLPKCSGQEIAQLIRQDVAYELMPMIFLSANIGQDDQIAAMRFGGDDFLLKPINRSYLTTAILARASRARKTRQINDNLKNALRENKFQLEAMNQHDIVSTTDVKGRIIDVNQKFCEVSGYSKDELLGKNHKILKSGLHSKNFYKELWGSISQGNIWHGRICNRKKDGSVYWVESTIVPFLNEKGKPYKYVSARTDVSSLIKSQERLRQSQVFANIGNWDWNIASGEIYWSEHIAAMFGQDEAISKTSFNKFIEVVYPDDRKKVIDAGYSCIEHGIKYNIEHRVVWPDGSIHWILESGDVTRNDNGDALHMLGVVQNIDFQKNAELAVFERERELQAAQSLAHIGNWRADFQTGQLVWSKESFRIFGYEPNSFEPSIEDFRTAIHPDDVEKVEQSESNAQKTGKLDVTHRIILPNGSIRYVHELAQTMLDAEGNLESLFGTIQDITERIEVENKIKETEARFSFAVEGAGDGVWDWNPVNNEIHFSAAHKKILGYDESELPFDIESWKKIIHPDDLKIVTNSILSVDCNKKYSYSEELRLLCKDGKYKWVLCRSSVVKRDENGNALRVIGIHSDITERKETEKKLIDARQDAEQANRAKSDFLASMSHELRTPMNAIIGFSQLLKINPGKLLDYSQLENVDEIIVASNHLLELINEMLDLSRIEAGRIDLSFEQVDIGQLIAECLNIVTPLAEKNAIKVSVKIEGNELSFVQLLEHDIVVWADQTRLKQVLLNLLSNAVKYNRKGGKIVISLEQGDTKYTRISVADTGEGLSETQISQLFEAFNRLGAERLEIEGTGIGLVITKRIIELMDGFIGVESEVGKGSVFWIEVLNEQVDAVMKEPMEKKKEKVFMLNPAQDKIFKVLYIEDNPANLRLVSQLLDRRSNIKMWSAAEPLLGLEMAVEHRPDLILLDINLPGMSGIEVLKVLREDEINVETPIIAVSANAMPKDIQAALDAGFDEYITKPLDVAKFYKVLDEVLNQSLNSEHINVASNNN